MESEFHAILGNIKFHHEYNLYKYKHEGLLKTHSHTNTQIHKHTHTHTHTHEISSINLHTYTNTHTHTHSLIHVCIKTIHTYFQSISMQSIWILCVSCFCIEQLYCMKWGAKINTGIPGGGGGFNMWFFFFLFFLSFNHGLHYTTTWHTRI